MNLARFENPDRTGRSDRLNLHPLPHLVRSGHKTVSTIGPPSDQVDPVETARPGPLRVNRLTKKLLAAIVSISKVCFEIFRQIWFIDLWIYERKETILRMEGTWEGIKGVGIEYVGMLGLREGYWYCDWI